MNILKPRETKQEFLRQLRTKIRNQEITKREVISLLGGKTNKCLSCGRSLTSSEPQANKKANQSATWAEELAKFD